MDARRSGCVPAVEVVTWFAASPIDVAHVLAGSFAPPATAMAALRGDVVLEFAIDRAGSAHGTHGQGLGEAADCVASVIEAIVFPHANRETTVTYAMAFRPS